ncbi:glycosyltransferase family 4 protein [Mucilaginibacter psychrotolerans]|uniref:Glycosyltransferase family 1 protein n=1 Tax=Mucilaginibacter psychrotolerans TaxID=1524096 RepID=A0A4Y8S8H0_9SPHI|nr:glycosyltransferase family 1 protein [Mucilaginibacter psychrotolerans]TFF34734.1 glycosyltransferase family 1 protein [Mucilaginibacter psychrotolerans]
MLLTTTLLQSEKPSLLKGRLQIAIEAHRIFRPHKHGMDVVAHELLKRLPLGEDNIDYHVMVKQDTDRCISTTQNRVVHMLKKAPYFIWEQFLLPKACKKIKADILHCTANTAPLNSTVPLILTLHDVIFLEQNNLLTKSSWYQRLGNMYRKALVGRIAKKAVKVITVSDFQKKLIIEKLGIAEDKIEVIHNGVDNRFFDKVNDGDLQAKLQAYGLKRGYIFFMSNSAPRKNTIGVLKAYAKLLILNSFSPRLLMKGISEAELTKLLKQENLLWMKGYIDTMKYIPQNDLPAIYQGASMLWFPSFSEGFGLPIIEAMASGTPVVTSNVSCMPEIAGDAALLVNPNKPNEIATAAYQILNLPLLKYSLIQAGQKRAASFSWDAATKKTVAIYHEIEKAI